MLEKVGAKGGSRKESQEHRDMESSPLAPQEHHQGDQNLPLFFFFLQNHWSEKPSKDVSRCSPFSEFSRAWRICAVHSHFPLASSSSLETPCLNCSWRGRWTFWASRQEMQSPVHSPSVFSSVPWWHSELLGVGLPPTPGNSENESRFPKCPLCPHVCFDSVSDNG